MPERLASLAVAAGFAVLGHVASSAPAQNLGARVFCHPGDPKSAEAFEASATDPDSTSQLLVLAQCYDTAWRFADAQRTIERLLELLQREALKDLRAPKPPDAPVYAGPSHAPRPPVTFSEPAFFPQPAISANRTGEVAIEFRVDRSGKVHDARVIESDPWFDRSTVQATNVLRFTPPKVNGQPHDVWLVFFARFGLPEELMPADWVTRARVYLSRGLYPHALGALETALARTKLDRQRLGDSAGWNQVKEAAEPPKPPPVNVVGPRKIKDVKPVYPEGAQANRIAGQVIIRALVDREGKVARAVVTKSIPMLDAAALDAVRQWEYTPALEDGRPVVIVMTVTVTFSLR